MDIRTIIRIDRLIEKQATGSPVELGNKIGMTERGAYKYLKFMKEELDAPIQYSKMKGTYEYVRDGEFNFKWKKNII